MFMLICVVIAVISRLLPHLPNFTAISSLVGFAILFSNRSYQAAMWIILTLLLSDLFLGFYFITPFVYLGYVVAAFTLYHISHKNRSSLFYKIPATSLIFFIIANFGVWLTSNMYEATFTGLISCYVAAIPFLANHFMADCVYGCLILLILNVIDARKSSAQLAA